MVANLRHHAADRVGVRKLVMLSFPDCRIAGPPLPSAPHPLFFFFGYVQRHRSPARCPRDRPRRRPRRDRACNRGAGRDPGCGFPGGCPLARPPASSVLIPKRLRHRGGGLSLWPASQSPASHVVSKPGFWEAVSAETSILQAFLALLPVGGEIREIEGHERAESGLDVGQEEIHPVESAPALPGNGGVERSARAAIRRERTAQPARRARPDCRPQPAPRASHPGAQRAERTDSHVPTSADWRTRLR